MSSKITIPITVISDTICPWCYIGKRRLERAIASYRLTNPDINFSITWKPFYLDPMATVEDKLGRYNKKFGAGRVAQMIPYMIDVAKKEGIEMKYGGLVGPTQASHRLIKVAEGEGNQDAVVNAFFDEYFTQNSNISDPNVLAGAAAKAGLMGGDAEKIQDFLETEDGQLEVEQEVFQAQRMGVSGVPHFIVDGRYELGGAQEPPAFLRVFNEVVKSKAASGAAAPADGCTDGSCSF
ncbi:hypothetical protein YB2330_002175 [Saitoella coloradoensis]